jgi:hypothetical protein
VTLIGNAGIRWPELDEITREAGERALSAAAKLWQIFANVEGESKPGKSVTSPSDLETCAGQFLEAAGNYREMLRVLTTVETAFTIAPVDAEIAAVNMDLVSPLTSGRDIRILYGELAFRLETLASQISAFDVRADKFDLAPQAFQMMRQWETAACLGRLVATLNRRKDD